MYQAIEEQLPKEIYHWHLNPGHLVSDDEWMSSPIYPDSAIRLESGMLFQVDIIPSVPGYTGVSAEECVALADETLQKRFSKLIQTCGSSCDTQSLFKGDIKARFTIGGFTNV